MISSLKKIRKRMRSDILEIFLLLLAAKFSFRCKGCKNLHFTHIVIYNPEKVCSMRTRICFARLKTPSTSFLFCLGILIFAKELSKISHLSIDLKNKYQLNASVTSMIVRVTLTLIVIIGNS